MSEHLHTKFNGIILTGMMGCGKSHIGRLLRNELDWRFSDLDRAIERKMGFSIPAFFSMHGEEAFRHTEMQVFEELMRFQPHIIATGGGALCRPSPWDIIPPTMVTVWLRAPVEVLTKRVKGGRGRPLLKDKDIPAELTRLLSERQHWYEKARVHVDAGKDSPEAIAKDIINALVTLESP